MTDSPALLLAAFAAGILLGALYLGSLWLVLQRLPRSRAPGFLLLGSAACRIGLLLAGWYWISGGKWDALLACLAGFLVIRIAATRRVRAGLRPSSAVRG
jgi:F1F0 ATPase subunit 2